MKKYIVKTRKTVDWNEIPRAEINIFKWRTGYEPRSFGQCAVKEGEGLAVRLLSQEASPLARKTEYFSDVYHDSCLEFFAGFDPSSPAYVNLELNAKGTLYFAYHPTGDRNDIKKVETPPAVSAYREGDFWCVEFLLSLELLKSFFPNLRLDGGSSFRGNFYKCGDETDMPHYGMWNEVKTEQPDFHRPEFFGEFVIE